MAGKCQLTATHVNASCQLGEARQLDVGGLLQPCAGRTVELLEGAEQVRRWVHAAVCNHKQSVKGGLTITSNGRIAYVVTVLRLNLLAEHDIDRHHAPEHGDVRQPARRNRCL